MSVPNDACASDTNNACASDTNDACASDSSPFQATTVEFDPLFSKPVLRPLAIRSRILMKHHVFHVFLSASSSKPKEAAVGAGPVPRERGLRWLVFKTSTNVEDPVSSNPKGAIGARFTSTRSPFCHDKWFFCGATEPINPAVSDLISGFFRFL